MHFHEFFHPHVCVYRYRYIILFSYSRSEVVVISLISNLKKMRIRQEKNLDLESNGGFGIWIQIWLTLKLLFLAQWLHHVPKDIAYRQQCYWKFPCFSLSITIKRRDYFHSVPVWSPPGNEIASSCWKATLSSVQLRQILSKMIAEYYCAESIETSVARETEGTREWGMQNHRVDEHAGSSFHLHLSVAVGGWISKWSPNIITCKTCMYYPIGFSNTYWAPSMCSNCSKYFHIVTHWLFTETLRDYFNHPQFMRRKWSYRELR